MKKAPELERRNSVETVTGGIVLKPLKDPTKKKPRHRRRGLWSEKPPVVNVMENGEPIPEWRIEIAKDLIRQVALKKLRELEEEQNKKDSSKIPLEPRRTISQTRGKLEQYLASPKLTGSKNRPDWLPEPSVIRTKHKITIPYNPLTLQRKLKIPKREHKPLVNIYLTSERYSRLLKLGVVKNQTELAQQEGMSRARITQILNLLKLAPEIREYLRNLTDQKQIRYFTERRLRELPTIENHETQRQRFSDLSKSIKKLD